MSGLACVGLVVAIYQMHAGTVADAHVTEANHPSLQSSKKKAGYISFLTISALTLITRDGNVAVLGYTTIAAMELVYQHAISNNPVTQQMEAPVSTLYQAAQNTVPAQSQGTMSDPYAYAG